MIGPFYTDSKGDTTTSLEDHLIVNAKNRYNGNESSESRIPKTKSALICLQGGCTEYLKKFDERVDPFELPVINLMRDRLLGGIYPPADFLENSTDIISAFANNFQSRYPDVEQVYVCSAVGPIDVQSRIYAQIPNIFLKRTILVPEDICWLNPGATQFDKIHLDEYLKKEWIRDHIPNYTNEEEILKIVKGSLNFRSN